MSRRTALAALALGATLALPAAPAHACMGEVCDAINFVCATAFKGAQCVG